MSTKAKKTKAKKPKVDYWCCDKCDKELTEFNGPHMVVFEKLNEHSDLCGGTTFHRSGTKVKE